MDLFSFPALEHTYLLCICLRATIADTNLFQIQLSFFACHLVFCQGFFWMYMVYDVETQSMLIWIQ